MIFNICLKNNILILKQDKIAKSKINNYRKIVNFHPKPVLEKLSYAVTSSNTRAPIGQLAKGHVSREIFFHWFCFAYNIRGFTRADSWTDTGHALAPVVVDSAVDLIGDGSLKIFFFTILWYFFIIFVIYMS